MPFCSVPISRHFLQRLVAPHPAARLGLWVVLVFGSQQLAGARLALVAMVVVVAALVWARARMLTLLKRTRWLLLSVGLVFAFATPGQVLIPAMAEVSPSVEGVWLGLQHGARLLCVLSAVALLMQWCSVAELVCGLHALMKPLVFLKFDRDRAALRLALVLALAAGPRRASWRAWLEDEGLPGPVVWPRVSWGFADSLVVVVAATVVVLMT